MPHITYKIYYSEEYGRRDEDNSVPFNLFTTVDEYIKYKTRITGIQMQTMNYEIHCITVDFESTTGRRTEKYGIDEGCSSKKLVLEEGDFIKKLIYTRSADNNKINRLGIFVDENRSIIAGVDIGTEQTFNVPDGSFILGFTVFYSGVINELQIIYAAFQPAKWSQLI
uniref:Jacalin-type lectin domain-containing protein n=1 Tax=Cannabis sativa TaxID=3483 RepID=A0A803R2J4_CANSA